MALLKLQNQIPPAVGINWSQIWNLNVPGKIQNFIWRSLSNVLPTMKSLRHRRIEIPEWCPLCRHEEEDGLHALVSCSLVRNIWHLTSIGSYIGSAISLPDWWQNLTTTRDSSDIEMAAILMWNIWQNRNDVVWNGKSKPAALIFSSAMSVHSQWVASRNRPIPRSPHPIQQ
ncbi:uncharacterized protein [Henckelia pumila]|uniref:uncharacterized protein n=1 Tax=Henckelia pumila TaxID=405737 RepID=UPI003C6DB7FA